MSAPRAVVVGQLARDLVLLVERMPEAGTSADASRRREMLGGKGANQAVALAQLGASVALVAVAGDDEMADRLLAQARADGIDVSPVVQRPGAPTGLIVEALDGQGRWRYLQHLPDEVLLTEADVAAAAWAIGLADAVLVQLQQPPGAALAAAEYGRRAGALVLLDGAPADDGHRDRLLAAADVVRADARETRALTGVPADDPERVRRAAAEVLANGPGLVALALESSANLFVWSDPRWGEGHVLVPPAGERVVDTTGAGDSLVAALTVALLAGDPPADAARFAVTAAGSTVGHPGGRPDLTGTARPGPTAAPRVHRPAPVGWPVGE